MPKPGGLDGELMDEWLEFYHRPENEPEFPLRNEQVRTLKTDSINDDCIQQVLWQAFNTLGLSHFFFYVCAYSVQVKQRASEVRQGLDLLNLLNDGGDIQNMLEEGKNFDYGQFKGRLDVDVAAVMGHSFGGATTVQVLSEESRFL